MGQAGQAVRWDLRYATREEVAVFGGLLRVRRRAGEEASVEGAKRAGFS